MLLSLGRGMAPAPAPPPILGSDRLLAENGRAIATTSGLILALDLSVNDPSALLTEAGWSLLDEAGFLLLPDVSIDLTTEGGLALARENDSPLLME